MDLTGQRFGRLIVVGLHHYTYGSYHWNVQCDCGNMHVAKTALLRNGKVKSCGCLKINNWHANRKVIERSPEEKRTYKVWSGMMGRCYNPASTRFADWGGRGIIVCERWHTFENFLADMGNRPPGLTIDRIDNDGNYEPSNCKWSTVKEQNSNKRPMKATHAQICSICGTNFMSVMPWASYCSDGCHNEATKRQMREKRERNK